MISLHTLVWFVIWLLVAGAVFALLWYLVHFVAREWGFPPFFLKAARTVLVVLAILVLIGLLLNLMGYPVLVLR